MQKAESRAQQLEEELHRRDSQITHLKLELEKLKQVVDNLINANH